MKKDNRTKRDLHALDENGMVLCNPRDREAAHRADEEHHDGGLRPSHLPQVPATVVPIEEWSG